MRRLHCYCLILLCLAPLAALAAQDSKAGLEWLDKMSRAQQALNYHGTFVYFHDGQIESIKVAHTSSAKGERERLVHLNGSAREVVRNNDIVTCIFPEDRVVVMEKRQGKDLSPLLKAGSLEEFDKYYHVMLMEGGGRIAGREARLVEVRPIDGYRYGHRFWISDEGLLLRSDLLDERQQLVEQIMFTEIHVVDEVPHQLLIPEVDIKQFTWYRQDEVQEERQSPGKGHWKLTAMPQGFKLKAHHNRKPATGEESPVEHLLISDGLASISVFIERAKDGPQEHGSFRMGALNVHTLVFAGHHVTVLGDVPLPTVRMIAESIQAAR